MVTKTTDDVRVTVSEITRAQNLDTNQLNLDAGLEIGYSPPGVATVSFVNVTASVVSGTQTNS